MAEHIFNVSQALPLLPSSAASHPFVWWGDLLSLLLYGDQGDQSPWDSDATKSLAQLASPQPPMLTPLAQTAHTSIPPSTIVRSTVTPKSPISTLPEPPSKDFQPNTTPPPPAKAIDPITPRT